MDSARISEDERAARQKLNEGPVIERRDQVYSLNSAKETIDSLLHLWVQMNRVDTANIRIQSKQLANC